MEKKLDGNYTRMLWAILNKSWRQHPTKHQLYGYLPPITKTIQVRRNRHARSCWRSRDELINDVFLWTPSQDRVKVGRPAWTYIQQLCEDTGCRPEDLPEAMNDREKWREKVRDIRASGKTRWWWWWYIYINIYIYIPHYCQLNNFSQICESSTIFRKNFAHVRTISFTQGFFLYLIPLCVPFSILFYTDNKICSVVARVVLIFILERKLQFSNNRFSTKWHHRHQTNTIFIQYVQQMFEVDTLSSVKSNICLIFLLSKQRNR